MFKKKLKVINYKLLFTLLDDTCDLAFINIMKPNIDKLRNKYDINKLVKYNSSVEELKSCYKSYHIYVLESLSQDYIHSLLLYVSEKGLLEIIMTKGQILTTQYLDHLIEQKASKDKNVIL